MTPPDRSVERAVKECGMLFPNSEIEIERTDGSYQTLFLQDWLRTTLTSLHTLGIEAGSRERDTQVQDVVRALDECIECCELVNGSDYCKNCGLAKEMYATLKHPNENET